jgi:hypothetical protein
MTAVFTIGAAAACALVKIFGPTTYRLRAGFQVGAITLPVYEALMVVAVLAFAVAVVGIVCFPAGLATFVVLRPGTIEAAVHTGMLSEAHNRKIFRPIVMPDAVTMVHMLFGQKRPAKHLRHNMSMLGNGAAIGQSEGNIPILLNTPTALPVRGSLADPGLSAAVAGAKSPVAMLNVPFWGGEGPPAKFAGSIYEGFCGIMGLHIEPHFRYVTPGPLQAAPGLFVPEMPPILPLTHARHKPEARANNMSFEVPSRQGKEYLCPGSALMTT